jgi:hypothetical protein
MDPMLINKAAIEVDTELEDAIRRLPAYKRLLMNFKVISYPFETHKLNSKFAHKYHSGYCRCYYCDPMI